MSSLQNGCDPLISWLPHTVHASAARTVVQHARSSKKEVITFPFQSDRRAVKVCCVQSLYSVSVSLSYAGCSALCMPSAVRLVEQRGLRDQVKFGHQFSLTQFGSPTAQIPLESGSSADKRFRTDLKNVNKNCIIHVSQADVQSERG